jgi:diacylglycerol kinase (ATP)
MIYGLVPPSKRRLNRRSSRSASASGYKYFHMAGKALVIVNLRARTAQQRVSIALHVLRSAGFGLVVPDLPNKQSVTEAIRQNANTCDLVVVVGGDGSLNVALQGLVGIEIPLGILPFGTANDLANSLGIVKDIEGACQVIARGVTRQIDVGCVNDVYFFNEMSIGMSPTVSRLLTKDAKAKLGIFASLYRTLQVMRRMPRFAAEISCDGEHLVLKTAQLTIGNSKSFGGLIQSDEASLQDHKLDLYSVSLPNWKSYFDGLFALARRHYDDASCVATMHGREFYIRTKRPRPIEADGEIISMTPASVRVVPKAVRVFIPATAAT